VLDIVDSRIEHRASILACYLITRLGGTDDIRDLMSQLHSATLWNIHVKNVFGDFLY
jgi:hypothetical protein